MADMTPARSEQILTQRDFRFASGVRIDLDIAYWTYGILNAARDNAIFLCPGASGERQWPLEYCAPGRTFDVTRWFIVSMDLPGGGGSSRLRSDATFPAAYAVADLANAVLALMDALELSTLHAYCGASMAGVVGLELASRRPERVRSLALWATGYRCGGYALATIDVLRAILTLDASPAGVRAGALALLPALVDRQLLAAMQRSDYIGLGQRIADDWIAKWRGDELMARYAALAECDLGTAHGGVAALADTIRCPAIFLSVSSDAIMPASDVEHLANAMRHSQVRTFESPYGHLATALPAGTPEFAFFDSETRAFLDALS